LPKKKIFPLPKSKQKYDLCIYYQNVGNFEGIPKKKLRKYANTTFFLPKWPPKSKNRKNYDLPFDLKYYIDARDAQYQKKNIVFDNIDIFQYQISKNNIKEKYRY